MSDRTTRLVVLLLALAFAVSPFLSSGFGGFDAESFPVQAEHWPAQPAGWAFSIWGVIYLGLILAAAWAVWRPQAMPGWGRTAWPLGLSLLIGTFWVEVAMGSPLVATAMILVMAPAAIIALLRAGPDWRTWAPIGLYAGWLTAASGVAVSVVATGYGLLSAQTAAVALILCVLIAALAVAAARPRVWTYRAGVIWALFGVIVANSAAHDWLIVAICGAGIALLALFDRFTASFGAR
ncbi:MAG: hypothetical protein H6895_14365 [Defluviimonas sp.]|uniref:hypothetical protein n=1 Tax=Albidovulum sp. TaxID=1872424 RepID=UPI002A2FA7E0|nr:hypothetical protein [Defluviimonas sp.]